MGKFKKMMKSSFLLERIDYMDTAKQMVKKYKLKFDFEPIIPVGYIDMLNLIDHSQLIITDSGGVQEEAPSLGKPVLVMRETTERPEAVDAGTVILVGTNVKKIVGEANALLQNAEKYEFMSKLHNPYGDGKASKRIVEFLSDK